MLISNPALKQKIVSAMVISLFASVPGIAMSAIDNRTQHSKFILLADRHGHAAPQNYHVAEPHAYHVHTMETTHKAGPVRHHSQGKHQTTTYHGTKGGAQATGFHGEYHGKPKQHGQQPTVYGETSNKQLQGTNTYTHQNLHDANVYNQEFKNNYHNEQMLHHINNYQRYYHQNYYGYNQYRYNNYYHSYWYNPYYHNWYYSWFPWGFYGGYWFPVTPLFAIDQYFYYPTVQWFYVDSPTTAAYYYSYYSSEPKPPKACVAAFPYRQVYFPTVTLKDLLVEASNFSQTIRCNFRVAIVNFTGKLQQEVSDHFATEFTFSKNDVVIDYYQNLQNQAIVIAGFVDHGTIHMAFEGFLDLNQPEKTIIFAPKGKNPTPEELQLLNNLNDRIKALGGDPFSPKDEPAPTSGQGTIDQGTTTQGTVEQVPANQGTAAGP